MYTEGSRITINPAESLNAILKRFLKTQVALQVLVLSLYQLDQFYVKEIIRGRCRTGKFILKSEKYYVKPEDMLLWKKYITYLVNNVIRRMTVTARKCIQIIRWQNFW